MRSWTGVSGCGGAFTSVKKLWQVFLECWLIVAWTSGQWFPAVSEDLGFCWTLFGGR